MSSNIQHRIGIGHDPVSFEKLHKGVCNGMPFLLSHTGKYNAGTEDMDIDFSIIWEGDVPSNEKTLRQGIIKLFKGRLDAEK